MRTLEIKERDTHKGKNNRMRKAGELPGVVYGGEKSFSVSSKYSDFAKVFKEAGEHDLITLKYDGKSILALIRDFQLHPVTDRFLHFDLLEVSAEKEVKTRVPIKLVGTPKGIKGGGVLEELTDHINIAAKGKDLPHEIEIDIKDLDLGESLHLSDVKAPKGVTFTDDAETTLVTVAGAKAEVEEPSLEEGAAETEENSAE